MSSRRPGAVVSTSIPELDLILGGGLPAGSVTVIAGEPGSGKTVLTLQMLFHAARRGDRCLYFTTLSEPAIKVIRYVQSFDFYDESLIDDRILFIDLGAAIRAGSDATIKELVGRIERHEPAFIAIDSFRAIGERLADAAVARSFVYDLATQVAGWGATTLLVGEYDRDESTRFSEFAIADGILRLGSERVGLTSLRELEVLTLRGSGYVAGRHFFDISGAGVAVYPRVRAPDPLVEPADLEERIGTGVAGLDRLLDGGVPRGSSTVLQGSTGTGKTLVGLSFLLEGVRRGERGLLFTLEETPAQLRAVARGFGWDLAAAEARGDLAIQYTSPVELSTDRFLNDARARVVALGARRVVFDSLTTMALGVTSDRRFKELVYAISKHMRSLGASLFMTMESDQLLGSLNLSGLGVSFIADNLILLRYLEIDGRLERALSVLKARGVNHDTEVCAVTIGRGGMTLTGARYKELRGLLTGLPSRGD